MPFAEGFQEHDALAAGDHDPRNARSTFLAHRVADDGERLLSDLVVRRDIVRRFEVSLVHLFARHEALDVDRVGALDPDGFEFLILDDEDRSPCRSRNL